MLNFAEKLFAGVVSITMMLFSSYEGNHARFSEVLTGYNEEVIMIRTSLVNAFENDFEQIFRSGSPVTVTIELKVSRDNQLIDTKEYRNTVLFDPLNRYFQVEAEASNYHSFTTSFDELITVISEIDIFYETWGIEGTYRFELTAGMDRVHLASLDKEFDLMMLWHYKNPRVTFEYKVERYEI